MKWRGKNGCIQTKGKQQQQTNKWAAAAATISNSRRMPKRVLSWKYIEWLNNNIIRLHAGLCRRRKGITIATATERERKFHIKLNGQYLNPFWLSKLCHAYLQIIDNA